MIRRILHDRVLIALLAVALMYPIVLVLIHSPATSPLDEWVFIDYLSKVFSQGFVRDGERVGELTNTVMSCYGVIPGGTFGTCGLDLQSNLSNLPYTGLTAAAAYTPAYFWVTRILGIPFQLIGIGEVEAWRLTGAIWLAAGIVVFVLLLRKWGIQDRVILPIGLLIIASPYVWWAHTFVSTDAPSLLVGAALLYLATMVRRGELRAWWLVPLAAVSVALKVTNLVGVGLMAVYLVGSWVVDTARSKFSDADGGSHLGVRGSVTSLVIWPIIAAVSAVLVQVGWSKFIAATAIAGDRANQGISSKLTLSELGLQATNFLSSVLSYSPFTGHGKDFLFTPLAWIVIAGAVGAFINLRKINEPSMVVTAILVSAIAMAPALAIAVQFAQGAYFQLSPRYGASLIPAFMLCLGFIMRNRIAGVLAAVYAGGLMFVGLAAALMLN